MMAIGRTITETFMALPEPIAVGAQATGVAAECGGRNPVHNPLQPSGLFIGRGDGHASGIRTPVPIGAAVSTHCGPITILRWTPKKPSVVGVRNSR